MIACINVLFVSMDLPDVRELALQAHLEGGGVLLSEAIIKATAQAVESDGRLMIHRGYRDRIVGASLQWQGDPAARVLTHSVLGYEDWRATHVWGGDGGGRADAAAHEVAREVEGRGVSHEARWAWVTGPIRTPMLSAGKFAFADDEDGDPVDAGLPIHPSVGVEWRRTAVRARFNNAPADVPVVLVRMRGEVRAYADWMKGDPMGVAVASSTEGRALPAPPCGWASVWDATVRADAQVALAARMQVRAS